MDPHLLADRWHDMIRDGDEAAFAGLITAGYQAHGPGGTGDPDAFIAWLRWYTATFTEQRWTAHDVIAAGDKVVVRYSCQSVYRGGFLDLPGSGQPVHETGILILRLAGEKVAESWFEGNDLEIAQQLGGRVTT